MTGVSVRVSVEPGAVKKVVDARRQRMAKLLRAAAETAGRSAVLEPLRAQTKAAFPNSPKMPTTWRIAVYPDPSRHSLEPAAYIYSLADDIIRAFDEGATIRPTGGRRFLWIPTANVPTTTGGRSQTPKYISDRLGKFVFLRSKKGGGRLLALVSAEAKTFKRPPKAGKTAKPRLNFKKPTKAGRAAGRVSLVPMFVLTPQVTLRKRLDIQSVRDSAPAVFAARVRAELSKIG